MIVFFHLGTNLYMVLNNTKIGYYQYFKNSKISVDEPTRPGTLGFCSRKKSMEVAFTVER